MKMKNNYVLVTGAAGFIGARLVKKLLMMDRRVVAVDCFLPDLYSSEVKIERWNNLTSPNLKKVFFDLRKDDFSWLESFEIDSIYNLAAMPGLISDWSRFATYYDCNLSALNRLLEFARVRQVKSFVQASTSSVYGREAVGVEDQELNPISPYGVSKLAAEKLLLAYHSCYGTPVKILRYFSVYGPSQRPDMAYAKIINALVHGLPFEIYGDGLQRRSNTYIDDIVEATILSESMANPSTIINICGDETISLNDAISILEGLSGKILKRNFVGNRRGDQRETSGSNIRAKQILNWQCKTNVETGLENQLREFTLKESI